ncbi:hypothetical protein HZB88_02980 [archaeon]|nr:hypothetical protein [archaeon]
MEKNMSYRELFDIDNLRGYRELNPDYSNKKEAEGRKTWMNFPDSSTISKEEFKNKIHGRMLYYPNNKFAITMIFSGKEACLEFLGRSNNMHENIDTCLSKLPHKFFIRDGNSFWDKSSQPPLDKEWNNPIPCDELSWEQYNEILNNLDNLIFMQKNGFKVGPVLDLAKAYCTYEEIPAVIDELRELYSLLLKPETKVDEISHEIKKLNSWEWYI